MTPARIRSTHPLGTRRTVQAMGKIMQTQQQDPPGHGNRRGARGIKTDSHQAADKLWLPAQPATGAAAVTGK